MTHGMAAQCCYAATVLNQRFLGINCASCDVSIEDVSLSLGFPLLTILFLKSVL